MISEDQFKELVAEHGPYGAARRLEISARAVFKRLSNIERKTGEPVHRPDRRSPLPSKVPGRLEYDIKDGIIVVGGDAHYWPGIISTAHQALVRFIKSYSPKCVVMNGDIFDGASISRHAPIAWEKKPTVILELEACKERLGEIESVSEKADRFWPLGNHDARFESRLAQAAPEYSRVHGMHLADHFPHWEKCWSVWVNDDVVIKHRYKGGIHATHNNALWSGKSMITNHLHSQKVTPLTDFNGDRWGVDTGTLAEPFGPQFTDYMEDNPRNWRSGFAVLTFKDYRLLQPELVRVVKPGVVDWRGRLWPI